MADRFPADRTEDVDKATRARAALNEIYGDQPYVLLVESMDNGAPIIDLVAHKINDARLDTLRDVRRTARRM